MIVNEGRINSAKYLRSCVFIDINKPLVQFCVFHVEGEEKILGVI
jgi:hypothetical protein